MQIYKTLIGPVVTYGCEVWTMKKEDENILRRSERKIMKNVRPSETREGMEDKK
jgi:hypothetical protein